MRKKPEMTAADFEAEATHETAEQIAEIETMKELAKVTSAEPTQEERERLIAEASRMAGRAEGLKVVREFATVSELLTIKSIIDSKLYVHMPDIKTVEKFCESIGYSYRLIKERLDNLNTFGIEFYETVSDFKIGYRELKQLRKATSDGTLSIAADSVIIEGEVIQLDDKDELKEALEELIADQHKKLKAKDEAVKEYAKSQETAYKAMKLAEKEQKKAEDERDTLKEKLNTIYHGRLGDVAEEDREDFQTIANVEMDFNTLLGGAIRLSAHKLSEFNGQMLCAVVSKMMVAVDDLRQKLSLEYKYNFDGGILDKGELDKLSEGDTPQTFLRDE